MFGESTCEDPTVVPIVLVGGVYLFFDGPDERVIPTINQTILGEPTNLRSIKVEG